MDALSDSATHTVVVMSSAQVGKALAVDTPIATPSGWSTMGEISVGDHVFGRDGSVVRVTYVSPVMIDRNCYRVLFSDGASIVADADHRWYVEPDGRDPEVLTTSEIAATAKYGENRNRYAIPMAGALDLQESTLSISPYVLGAWLGDGHSASARIFAGAGDAPAMQALIEDEGYRTSVSVKRTCIEIVIDPRRDGVCVRGHELELVGRSGQGCAECSRIRARNAGRRSRGNDVQDSIPDVVSTLGRSLSNLGLVGNKHIPPSYLRASARQRLDLLQGLMDTDGTIGHKGRAEFVTINARIADGFGELLTSLGIKFRRSLRQPFCVVDGERIKGALAHRFSFLVYDDVTLFRLRRKRKRQRAPEGGRPTETLRRRIVSVDRVASVPVRCIQVDAADHLFLAGKAMVPTHNTEFLNNAAGFFIDQDPSPILVLQPTIEMGQAWSKDRLAPMIRDTPALKGKVKDARARDSGNTLLHKTFAGGHITIAGANSPSSLAARPIRVLMADEVDRYPESAGTEGDPVTLAVKRTTTFWNRKIALTSTPTVKGMSRIEAAYEESDKRRFYVPCGDCGYEQVLRWANVRWPEGEPKAAEYVCDECGSLWDDHTRWDAVSNGTWKAEAPFHGVAGFHLSELYSPWVKLAQVVQSFLDAKDSPERLKAWTNTSLGETWEERGETVGTGRLARLIEPYGAYDLPEDVIFATAGVDTQGDRLEVEVLGWGAGEQSWGIRYEIIHGDPAQPQVWEELENILSEPFSTASGRTVRILSAAIDSGGHHAEAVHRFCRDRFNRRIYAIKGQGGQGRPIWPARHSMARNKDRVFLIGVDTIKDMVHARWLIDEGDGRCHLPSDPSSGYDDVWMEQATAEERVTRYREGRPYTVWTLHKGKRNEAFDCRVYATAAMRSLPRGTRDVAPKPPETVKDPVEAGVQAVRRRRGNDYLGIGGGRYV